MNKLLIIIGIMIIAVGILWPLIQKLGLGHLPGDILIKKNGFNFYFPLTTCIIISLSISLILWFFNK
jgi:hypothetical protein